MGEEYRYPIEPAPVARRAAVVGGGPAGLRAAAVLSDRGHEVTLFEPGPLGGSLVAGTRSQRKQDLAALRDHLVHQVRSRKVTVVAQRADAGTLDGYDIVMVATGGVPRPVDGTRHARDIADPSEVASPVVIAGGGLTGVDTALWLADAGHRVTVVEAGPALLGNGEVFTDAITLPDLLAEAGVTVVTGTTVTGADASGARTADGGTIPAATVLAATGYTTDPAFADAVRETGAEVTVIGGARRTGRVFDALHDAFFAARIA